MLKGLEKYGIDPHMTYVGKYNDYYKSLPARDGYFIHPQNKKYKTEDPVHMGFIPASLTNFGFSIIESNEAFEVVATSIFYVDSDIRGIKWHKNVPCEPEDFIWYFQYIEE